MTRILIPGRHHVLTRFQESYFGEIAASGTAPTTEGPIDVTELELVWAVTSADHRNTRRNPIAGHRREAAIEAFGIAIDMASLVFLIDDVPTTDRFADHIVKQIEVLSRGTVVLDPADTLVATSTPSMIEMFQRLGYRILPIELDAASGDFVAPRAWDVLLRLVAAGPEWRSGAWRDHASDATQTLIDRYDLGDHIVALFSDPIVGDEGDLTETRDYGAYARSFDEGAERKYGYVRDHIVPGRIVDIGCATGSIIKLMGLDPRLRDADLYGIEVARVLYEMCINRKRLGEFANENTFFYQRNILAGPLFDPGTVDTTLTMSLTHEIESYSGRTDLERFIAQVYAHTAAGGVFINYDVVGPDTPDRPVLLWTDPEDGAGDDGSSFAAADREGLATHLDQLSTRARLLRFLADFRAEEGETINAEHVELNGATYHRMRMAEAAEFLSKKDYITNWRSEMHETFCFWSFADWKTAFEAAGFRIDDASHPFRNEWIATNRWQARTALFAETPSGLEPVDFPVTSMVLVGRK